MDTVFQPLADGIETTVRLLLSRSPTWRGRAEAAGTSAVRRGHDLHQAVVLGQVATEMLAWAIMSAEAVVRAGRRLQEISVSEAPDVTSSLNRLHLHAQRLVGMERSTFAAASDGVVVQAAG